MELEEIKKIIKNGNYGVVFPKSRKSEEAAMQLAELIENAKAVASFVDEEDKDNVSYGVIIEIVNVDKNGDN